MNMFRCPITGEAKDGDGLGQAQVQMSDTVKVNVQFFEANPRVKGQFIPTHVSPEAVEQLTAHIKAFKFKK